MLIMKVIMVRFSRFDLFENSLFRMVMMFFCVDGEVLFKDVGVGCCLIWCKFGG